ncbi:MAG: glucosaminidase domain-containing protein [Candidatus Levybacteria bacterium]|nr:glucosaminidase domain-containing protein [Candidatus Levybacteria bacterium]
MKNKLIIVLILALILAFPLSSFGEERASASSAEIQTDFTQPDSEYLSRVRTLKAYLEAYGSPMAENAEDFVREAKRYDLDWRFVAAIAGLESSFGKAIPYNSYNAWGWGVYGDNVIRFASWKEGIQTISQGLREKYMDKWGKTNVYEIGAVYAASPTWAVRVERFMVNIQAFALSDTQNMLPLSF